MNYDESRTALVTESLRLLQSGELAQCRSLLQHSYQSGTMDASLTLFFALVCRLSGDYDTAVAAARRSRSMQNTPEAYYEEGLALLKQDRFAEAHEVGKELSERYEDWRGCARRLLLVPL